MCPEWNSDGLKWVGLRNYLKCELKKQNNNYYCFFKFTGLSSPGPAYDTRGTDYFTYKSVLLF